MQNQHPRNTPGFTIVELLIVIVVIGILAALVIVAYNGIQERAKIAVIQSDLVNSSKRLETYKTATSDSERYPSGNDCSESPASGTICLDASQGVTFSYTYNSVDNSYCLQASSPDDLTYYISPQTGKPAEGSCPVVIVKAVSGATHSIALTNTGKVYAWGRNNAGQLGDGTATQSAIPKLVEAIEDEYIIDIATGHSHNLALSDTGTIYAWGMGTSGQLGNGASSTQTTPVTVTNSGVLSGKTITSVHGAIYGGFAIDSEGSAYAWGQNMYGQLGDGTTNGTNLPVAVADGELDGAALVSIQGGGGFAHAMGLTTDGRLFGWGDNGSRQLGDGTTTDQLEPVEIDSGPLSGKTVISYAVGNGTSFAVTSDGEVYAWGSNSSGQLGDGTTSNVATPTAITNRGTLSGRTVTHITTSNVIGGTHALTSDGALHGWGSNTYGNLGDGSTSTATAPVLTDMSGVLSGLTVVDIQTTAATPIARTSSGEIYSWGYGSFGALGNETTSNSSFPVLVTKAW